MNNGIVKDALKAIEEPEEDVHFVGVKSLEAMLSALSERAYCAGWHFDVEFIAWEAMRGEPRWESDLEIQPREADVLSRLSALIDGWVRWDNAQARAKFVPLKEWLEMISEWRGQPF